MMGVEELCLRGRERPPLRRNSFHLFCSSSIVLLTFHSATTLVTGWWIGRNDNIVWIDVLRVLILGPSSVDGWPSSR